MIFDWAFAIEIIPELLKAVRLTLFITVAAFAVSLAGGWVILWLSRRTVKPVAWVVIALSDLIRATPLLIQVFLLFFVLPGAGIRIDPVMIGIIAIGVHYSCYMSEVYRGALESVKRGQWEAAYALGLRPLTTFGKVILPQMLPLIVPTAGSYLIYMFKDTPILAAITVRELMQVSSRIGAENFRYMEPITLVGVLFLIMSLVASMVVRFVERRVKLPGVR